MSGNSQVNLKIKGKLATEAQQLPRWSCRGILYTELLCSLPLPVSLQTLYCVGVHCISIFWFIHFSSKYFKQKCFSLNSKHSLQLFCFFFSKFTNLLDIKFKFISNRSINFFQKIELFRNLLYINLKIQEYMQLQTSKFMD